MLRGPRLSAGRGAAADDDHAEVRAVHALPRGRELPRPSTDPQGQPFFDVSAHGISDSASHSPPFEARLDECQRQVGDFPYSFG